MYKMEGCKGVKLNKRYAKREREFGEEFSFFM